MNHQPLFPLMLACALVGAGCSTAQPLAASAVTGAQTAVASAVAAVTTPTTTGAVILQGRAVFPDAAQYKVTETGTDLANRATVSLIEPGGAVRAAGVTNAAGAFTLFQSTEAFTPVANAIYVLEISKRIGSGSRQLSMRTQLRSQQNEETHQAEWHSITGTNILVNLDTTAIAQLDVEDVTQPQGATIDIAPSGDYSQGVEVPFYFTNTPAAITARSAALKAALDDDLDPAVDARGTVLSQSVTVGYPNPASPDPSNVTLADLQSVEEIDGDLTINIDQKLTDLPVGETLGDGILKLQMPALRKVTGNVCIKGENSQVFGHDNFQLLQERNIIGNIASLVGLGNLTTIGGTLKIDDIDKLTNLHGLESLQQVGGLTITNNANLTSLAGLEQLVTVTNDNNNQVTVDSNAKLTTASALSQLKGCAQVTISNCNSLVTLPGLTGLLKGDVSISGTSAALPADAFLSTAYTGSLELEGIHSSSSGNALGGLKLGNASLSITDSSISDINALSGITQLCSLTLNDDSINDLGPLSSLVRVPSLTLIEVGGSSVPLNALAACNTVDIENVGASTISLGNLSTVATLTINSNRQLTTLSQFTRGINVTGSYHIVGNPQFTNFPSCPVFPLVNTGTVFVDGAPNTVSGNSPNFSCAP